MNPRLSLLQPYPFEKMATLLGSVTPTADKSAIALSIGEPRHTAPELAAIAMVESLPKLANYPATKGEKKLREVIANWLCQRFQIDTALLDSEQHVLPVNGTREALFAIAQCIITPKPNAKVVTANPFYQIYEGAALLAGAQPHYLNPASDSALNPDFRAVPNAVWQDCQLLYVCSPNNPTGATIDVETFQFLIKKAEQFDFVIASDECYSEIYFDEAQPPAGLLQAAVRMGNTAFKHCLVFHSLSKRSNLPGLRSGFVAGDAAIIKAFFQYRTYHGSAMSPVTQASSIATWQDEVHVIENRRLYQEKFAAVLAILKPVMALDWPDAGFYLWPKLDKNLGLDDELFAQQLYKHENIKVVPGSYLSRTMDGVNPGAYRIRMALVAELSECIEAATRIKHFITTFQQG